MKANKFFAWALAAVTMFGFASCDPVTEAEDLSLDQTSVTIAVGEQATITATVEATWSTNNPEVATVEGNGLTATITAVAEGNAIITATANGQTKTCVVLVQNAGGTGAEEVTINAKRIWPVILDAETAAKYSSLIAGDFRVNDVDNHLYIWADGETYIAGEGTGFNYFRNNEGYVSLTVAAPAGWSGLGFCIENVESVAAMKELKDAIVANPDNFYLHVGIKSTTAGNHQFYTFNSAANSFAIGTATIETGAVIGDFTRDGAWYGFDVPMSTFVNTLASYEVESGHNIFCVLSGAAIGSQLNLDAVYFYEK